MNFSIPSIADLLNRPVSKLFHVFTSMSVRLRIAVIALIPVIGFLANGFSFATGEADVDTAFRSVKAASELKDASRDFKEALDRMRTAATEFARDTRTIHLRDFDEAHAIATKSLQNIEINANAAISTAVSEACRRNHPPEIGFRKIAQGTRDSGLRRNIGDPGHAQGFDLYRGNVLVRSELAHQERRANACGVFVDHAPASGRIHAEPAAPKRTMRSRPKSRISMPASRRSSPPTS